MSDENEKDEQESSDENDVRVAGERLADARREQKVSVLEIAKELHLDEFKVRALESNDFDVIGAPVFAKGHLKKYAQLLGVDDATVMGEYFELTRTQAGQPPLSVRPKPKQAISPGPWLALLAVVIAVALIYWWLTVGQPFSDADDAAESAEAPQTSTIAPNIALPESSPEEAPAQDEDEQTEIEAAVVDEAPEPAVEAPEESNEIRLNVSFTGDSWTEISDAQGRRLFFELGKAGRTVNLSGEAPFNVLFGDAQNVRLQLNDVDYQLPPADRRGTVRLTITQP